LQREYNKESVGYDNIHSEKLMKINDRIAQAVEAIKTLDCGYWNSTLVQRLPSGAGSIVEGFATAEDLEKGLIEAVWEEYSHPAVMEGCVAYKTHSIHGKLGVKPLAELPLYALVTLDDRKNTGTVSAVVKGVLGAEVDFTVIILGIEDGKEVVFTFHPGEPVNPSKVQAGLDNHGKTVTVKEALGMGFETVKIA
jgi:hypothetical protein